MRTTKFGFLALVAGALALGACESKQDIILPTPQVDTVVTITPNPVPQLKKGQTAQLVATVQGTSNQAVTWSVISGSNVASVSASGLVTANAPGVAVVQAVSQANPNAKAAVSISVADTTTGGTGPIGQPSISIGAINQNGTNTQVNPGNVFGTVDVIMNVDIPVGVSASAVRVTVNGVEVCRQAFSNSGSADPSTQSAVPVQITCTINTAALNNGVAVFPNGTYQVRAEVLNPSGTVIASATSQQLVFNNADAAGISATVINGSNAFDAAGLRWDTGDLQVTISPAIYSGSANNVSRATITVTDTNTGATATQTVTTANSAGAFVATFQKSGGAAATRVDDFEGPVTVTVTTVTAAGNNGPANFAATGIRLDNQAPDDTNADATVATFVNPANNWYGASTSLASADRVANLAELSDEGVNSNTVTYEYTTDLTGAAGWTAFTSTSQLPQTTTTNGFLVRARVCDKLNNCTTVTSGTATGGDVTAPTIAQGAVNDTILNPAAERDGTTEMTVSGTENLSGFPANFVDVQIVRNTSAGARCIDPATGAATTVPAGGCAFVAQNSTNVDIPAAAGDGYFDVTVRLRDQAGNVSSTVSRTYLVDTTAPTATVNALTFTGSQVTVTGTANDNLDVRGWDTELTFAGANVGGMGVSSLPFTQFTADGTFGLPLTTSVAASGTAPIIRQVDGFALSNAGFGAADVANNFGRGMIGFTATAGDGIDNAAAVGLTNPAPTVSPTTLCRSGTTAACGTADVGKTTATLTYTPQTNADTNNPISSVYFYALVPAVSGGTYAVLVGNDATADLTINTPGNTRNWAYSTTQSVSALPPVNTPGTTYAVTYVAVPVDAEGDAVSSPASAVVTVK